LLPLDNWTLCLSGQALHWNRSFRKVLSLFYRVSFSGLRYRLWNLLSCYRDLQSWSKILGALSRNSITFTSFLTTIYILAHFMQNFMSKHPLPPNQCCVTPWTYYNTLHTALNGGRGGGVLCLLLTWESNFAQSVLSAPIFLTRIVATPQSSGSRQNIESQSAKHGFG
jgi:hypothetical protein